MDILLITRCGACSTVNIEDKAGELPTIISVGMKKPFEVKEKPKKGRPKKVVIKSHRDFALDFINKDGIAIYKEIGESNG